jgi:hypothetical protein
MHHMTCVACWTVQVKFDAAPFRVFRVFRIFQLDRLCGAFSVMAEAFRACQDTMIAFGLVAIIVWVGSASLFYVFEANNDLPARISTFHHPLFLLFSLRFVLTKWC